jgi:SAM-dependent methyltransferase
MKPDYGVDAPGVVRGLFIAAAAVLLIALLFPRLHVGPVVFITRPMAWTTAPALALGGALMLLYAKWGKCRHRDRMLAMIAWKGNEMVLDVGTGRGLLMIGAAKHLTSGRSVGIDIWSAKDLSGNRPEATLRNAEVEGVGARVEVKSEDATAMTFADATFDVVLSNLCIHNIPSREGRDKACREIVRVLKPGGTALISDFMRTGEYAGAFRGAGAQVERTGMDWLTYPPLRVVTVRK